MLTSFAPRLICRFSARATSFQTLSRATTVRSFGSTTPSLSDTNAVVHVPIDEARDTTAKALQKLGWDAEDAALQAEIMTAAELCGNNQVGRRRSLFVIVLKLNGLIK